MTPVIGTRAPEHIFFRRAFVLLPAAALTWFAVRAYDGMIAGTFWPLRAGLDALFAVMFGWLALMAMIVIGGAAARLATLDGTRRTDPSIVPKGRVAVLMPIYEEYAPRVFAALATMAEDVDALQPEAQFHFFALSDSRGPEQWLREEEAFLHARQGSRCGARLFYRRRTDNVGRKAGNIADFFARWGGAYDYVLILDADSVMGGDTMLELARRMDLDPKLGLLQAPCRLAGSHSLLARLQQFASSLCGPLLEAGLDFFCGDEGNYWGHNAIARTAAFRSCGLPKLSGKAPFGGEILSHDFVEAGLVRRAGYAVRMAWDLEQSFEECPTTWPELLVRDRRWCQGNLQHLKILPARDLHPMTRFHLAAGISSYLFSPLLVLFIALSGVARIVGEGVTDGALHVLTITASLLALPKVLGAALTIVDGRRRVLHGGAPRIALSLFLELALSMLLAPVMLLAQTRAVLDIAFGGVVGWRAQSRHFSRPDLASAVRHYGTLSLSSVLAGMIVFAIDREMGIFLAPLLFGLALSAVTTWVVGSTRVGRALRRLRLLMIPEETRPTLVHGRIHRFQRWLEQASTGPRVLDEVLSRPAFNAVHRALLRATDPPRRYSERVLSGIRARAANGGLATLSREEKIALLSDSASMEAVHREIAEVAFPARVA